ncbi:MULTISPECIES: hypothetical protein [Proteus]|uniref:hypothetical protein n=1 Tax=Proteus TaxID=583 RepID=UPI001F3B19BB|nr:MULTISPECIES: hypothetical protein [Proteus]
MFQSPYKHFILTNSLYCDGIKINKPKIKKAKLIKITTSGTVIKTPERIKTATGKVMATMTIQAESDKRSPYPLKIVAFDINALELMTCQKGNKVTATDRYEWFNGYQLTGVQIVTC